MERARVPAACFKLGRVCVRLTRRRGRCAQSGFILSKWPVASKGRVSKCAPVSHSRAGVLLAEMISPAPRADVCESIRMRARQKLPKHIHIAGEPLDDSPHWRRSQLERLPACARGATQTSGSHDARDKVAADGARYGLGRMCSAIGGDVRADKQMELCWCKPQGEEKNTRSREVRTKVERIKESKDDSRGLPASEPTRSRLSARIGSYFAGDAPFSVRPNTISLVARSHTFAVKI